MNKPAIPLPPKKLMWNVAMTRDESEFLRVGERCAEELKAAAAAAGLPFSNAKRVLDWGCGPCRTLRWLVQDESGSEYFGCDVDARAIRWCLNNAKAIAEFRVTSAKPPLPYGEGAFDIVFGVSVFSHLNASFQALWLEEMRRVIRPGGLLMLSLMGIPIAHLLPEEQREEFARRGFLFVESKTWKGVHSDWYADAYHTEGYVRETFSKHFEIASYIQSGMNSHQDLVVMRRPAR